MLSHKTGESDIHQSDTIERAIHAICSGIGTLHNVFITGASGCIGHYVVEALAACPGCHLFLLLRDPAKLKLTLDPARTTLIQGDLLHIDRHADILAETDTLIHLAAAWGDVDLCRAVNVTKTLELCSHLDADRCRKIIYFSTASLLDRHNCPIPVAGRAGTDYIRTKYEMLMRKSEIELRDRLVVVYPTLVFGGSPRHPYSHITGGLNDVLRWINLIRFLKVDGSFHFMHAADIAQIVRHLALNDTIRSGEWVVGNPAMHVDECVEQVCDFYKRRIYFRIPLPIRWAGAIARVFGAQLSEWDDYCIQHRHFVYDVVDPTTFNFTSHYPTITSLLQQYG